MIVVGVHLAAMQAPRRSDVETVGLLFDIGAHAAETIGERRDSIALFDSQLLRPRHGQAAPVRGESGEHRQLIDDAWHFVWCDCNFSQLGVLHDNRTRGLSQLATLQLTDDDTRTKTSEDVENRGPAWVQTDFLDGHL
jgi:hypothetical protein